MANKNKKSGKYNLRQHEIKIDTNYSKYLHDKMMYPKIGLPSPGSLGLELQPIILKPNFKTDKD